MDDTWISTADWQTIVASVPIVSVDLVISHDGLEVRALACGEYDCLHSSVVTAVSKIDLDQDGGQVVGGIAIAIGSH